MGATFHCGNCSCDWQGGTKAAETAAKKSAYCLRVVTDDLLLCIAGAR